MYSGQPEDLGEKQNPQFSLQAMFLRKQAEEVSSKELRMRRREGLHYCLISFRILYSEQNYSD